MAAYTLIAIADGDVLAGRNFVGACEAAEAGGATAIQIRMKNAPASLFLRLTEAVVSKITVPVMVNDRTDIALLAGAYGVHLGADDVPPELARSLPGGDRLRIGTSVGNRAEARQARLVAADYWGVGPVFPTANKGDAGAAIGCDGLARLVALAGAVPVVAIGGITAANAAAAIAAGARGVAAIGAVFGSPQVERAVAELRSVVDGSA